MNAFGILQVIGIYQNVSMKKINVTETIVNMKGISSSIWPIKTKKSIANNLFVCNCIVIVHNIIIFKRCYRFTGRFSRESDRERERDSFTRKEK